MQTQQTLTSPDAPLPDGDVFPQSFAQQRLWFMDQVEPGSAHYNAAVTITLEGRLEVDALHRALAEIVRRHEALRTVFAAVDGAPVQVIRPRMEVSLPHADLSHLSTDERAADAARRTREEAARGFDLARGPLFRFSLLRLAEEEHVLLLVMHHVVSDGWSLGVLFGELGALYDAFSRGLPSSLPELATQYADFAVWQREQLAGDELREQLDYWRRALAGAPAAVPLPADRVRPATPSHRGAVHVFRLPRGLDDELRTLARGEGATLFMILLAGWQALLHRCTGQDDLTVGTPVAGRTEPEVQSLIGFFVNMLALRADLSDDPTFRTLLARTRETATGALARQDVPFDRLVEELAPERALGVQPFFGVVFALQTAPWPPLRMPGLRLRMNPVDNGTARFDLTFTLREDADGIGGRMEYAADLFDETTIQRLAELYVRLLRAAVADPDARVRTLPLADDGDLQALAAWNATARPYPRDRALPDLIAERMREAPDAIAVVHGTEMLTYAELDARAERLALRLRAAGVGRGARVGVCMDRSAGLVTAWLAVIRTGAAYLPLDPALPAERLAWIGEDAGARVVVADVSTVSLVDRDGTTVLLVEDASGSEDRDGERLPAIDIGPDDVAYVVYTSGSTGRPKGAELPHRAAVRLARGTDFAQVVPGDRVALMANPAFDVATWEVWTALVNGAALVVIPRDAALSPATLMEAVREGGVTSLFLTTALFNAVARERSDAFRDLRQVVFGGEAADPESLRRVVLAGPPEQLLNGYGPTENGVYSAGHAVEDVPPGAATVPIGRPVANSTAYVLDPALRPVPAGLPGELCTGGDGLARGYLRRPGLTAERFVPNPFAAEPGARMYRTGDRVRAREDGVLEFLGRMDQQVKIRGFRIELGEIEAVLREYPGVAAAIVVVREDAPGERRLAAYVVPAAEAGEVEVAALRAHLRGRLPEYMVPGAFVLMDGLPLTPNGKVDRRALPLPDDSREALETEYVAPRTPLEADVAAIWAEVLGVERVGVHDRFFDLGGHSLLATQVVSRMRSALGSEISVRALFESPTVAGVAAAVERASEEATLRLLDELEGMDAGELARLLAAEEEQHA